MYDDDDGRVIAPMNVDGMPWYDRKTAPTRNNEKTEEDDFDFKALPPEERKEYKKETRAIIRGIILQFLPFLALFVGAFAIVILIMWLATK